MHLKMIALATKITQTYYKRNVTYSALVLGCSTNIRSIHLNERQEQQNLIESTLSKQLE